MPTVIEDDALWDACEVTHPELAAVGYAPCWDPETGQVGHVPTVPMAVRCPPGTDYVLRFVVLTHPGRPPKLCCDLLLPPDRFVYFALPIQAAPWIAALHASQRLVFDAGEEHPLTTFYLVECHLEMLELFLVTAAAWVACEEGKRDA